MTRPREVCKTCHDLVKSDVAKGAGNTASPLTHSSDSAREGLAMKATRICSVDSCETKSLARGWCSKHYARWERTGSVYLAPHTTACLVEGCPRPPRSSHAEYCEVHYYRLRRTGSLDEPRPKVSGICTVEGCEVAAKHRPQLCRNHYLCLKKHGDFRLRVHELHPHWTGDAATYQAVHQRVKKQRGRPGTHTCVDCGRRAQHWSYDRTDPNPKFEETKGPYSVDITRYQPRCVKCHKRFDMEHVMRDREGRHARDQD